MSTKIDCLIYLGSTLANTFTKLTSGPTPGIALTLLHHPYPSIG
jgi:hypothetical protein